MAAGVSFKMRKRSSTCKEQAKMGQRRRVLLLAPPHGGRVAQRITPRYFWDMALTFSRINIGTSGWHYDHWKGPFYPRDLRSGKMLPYYAHHFRTVEINNSFYQLPKEGTLEMWRNITPEDFIFSMKASRYITHMKKLKDPSKTLSPFLEAARVLEPKLGPLLFQLPPRWHVNPQRLQEFLNALPRGFRYAFEFRDPSWFQDHVYKILEEHGAAFCIYELEGRISPHEVTSDFVYVRLHGPGRAYQGQYDAKTLSGWAGEFFTWAGQGREIFCYFDNDQAGYAAQDALRIQAMVRKA
jgi:uncharacterized protein YecE (DUF72 family)